MPSPRQRELINQEGRILRALRALRVNPNLSIKVASEHYDVRRSTLSDHVHERPARVDSLANCHRLTQVEELVLIESVIDIDERGFPLGIVDIRDAAQLLFDDRDGGKVG
jgi:helix-turn-helix, Psq domain